MGVRFLVMDPGTAYTAARSVLEVTADTTHILRLLRAQISNESSVTSEQLEARIIRKSAAGTGTSRTPVDASGAGSTFGGTARSNMTAEGTVTDVLWREGWNVLTGWTWNAYDDDDIIAPPGGIIAIELPSAPAASITLNALLEFEVIGALT